MTTCNTFWLFVICNPFVSVFVDTPLESVYNHKYFTLLILFYKGKSFPMLFLPLIFNFVKTLLF